MFWRKYQQSKYSHLRSCPPIPSSDRPCPPFPFDVAWRWHRRKPPSPPPSLQYETNFSRSPPPGVPTTHPEARTWPVWLRSEGSSWGVRGKEGRREIEIRIKKFLALRQSSSLAAHVRVRDHLVWRTNHCGGVLKLWSDEEVTKKEKEIFEDYQKGNETGKGISFCETMSLFLGFGVRTDPI